jgi:Flp pilus assembly protein TadG
MDTPQLFYRRRAAGQNLVELMLTLPFMLLLLFLLIEAARMAFIYEGVGIAARQGAQAASAYHSVATGLMHVKQVLAATGLTAKTASIVQVPNQHAYEASVTVTYEPLLNLNIPIMGSNGKISPGSVDISFTSVPDVAVY